jgi:hypothetical protein
MAQRKRFNASVMQSREKVLAAAQCARFRHGKRLGICVDTTARHPRAARRVIVISRPNATTFGISH